MASVWHGASLPGEAATHLHTLQAHLQGPGLTPNWKQPRKTSLLVLMGKIQLPVSSTLLH